MKWIKYTAITLVVLLGLVTMVSAVVLVALDDDDYLQIVQYVILKTTGTELSVENDFRIMLGRETTIQAQGIKLVNAQAASAQLPLAQLKSLKVRLALWPLINKTLVISELNIRDAVISLPRRDAAAHITDQQASPDLKKAFLPVFEHVRVNRMTIVAPKPDSERITKIWLEQFSANKRNAPDNQNKVELEGQGQINAMAYRITGVIGTIETYLDRTTPYPIDIAVQALALKTRVKGRVQRGLVDSDLKLHVSSHGPEISRILSIWGIKAPALGTISLRADIQGTVRNPQVTDLKLTTHNPTGLDLMLSGQIGKPLQLENFDVTVLGRCTDPALLARYLPKSVPPVEVIELKGHLIEINRSFFIKCSPLTFKGLQGAQLVGTGNIWLGRRRNAPNPKNQLDLQLDLRAPSVAAPFKADTLPEVLKALKQVQVTGSLNGRFDRLALEDVNVLIGDERATRIAATGAIDQIQVESKPPVAGVALKGRLDIATLVPFFPDDAPYFSGLGPINGNFEIKDADGTIRITCATVRLETPAPLEIGVSGTVFPLDVFDLALKTRTSAARLTALPGLDGMALPDFQAIDLQAHVRQQKSRWDLEAVEIRCYGDKDEALRISGKVRDIIGRERSVISAEFNGDLTSDDYFQRAQLHLLDRIQGRTVIAKDEFGLKIEQLEIRSDGFGDIEAIMAGSLRPAKDVYAGDLQINILISDPQVIFALYGIKWPQAHRIEIKGRLNGDKHKATFSGQVAWGDNQMDLSLGTDLTGPRPRIEIDADSKSYQVNAVKRRPQTLAPPPKKSERARRRRAYQLFSKDTIDLASISDVDLLLRIQAKRMGIAGLELEEVNLNYSQVDGRMAFEPLAFKYTGGEVGFVFTLDSSVPVPTWKLDVRAKQIDLEQFITDWGRTPQLGGKLNLAMSLNSKGNSIHAIASALSGDAGFAIDQGWVPHGVDLLAADVFDALLTIPTAATRRDLNCLVTRFDFESGLGASRILSMDTDDFSALGGGTIDLRNEYLDLLINPKQKKRLVMSQSSPVRIFGPLTNLSFSKMPYREAAKLYGDIILPVIGISDRVLGYLWDSIKPTEGQESPCYIAPDQTN